MQLPMLDNRTGEDESMSSTLDIRLEPNSQDLLDMGAEVERHFESIKLEVQAAMAAAFYEIVMGNFGTIGTDRPWDWSPLSPAYARKVGRSYATLHVTGALQASVKQDATSPDAASVSMSDADVPYATAHHYGVPGRNLPARRVFPLDLAGHVTQFSSDYVVDAAKTKLREVQQ